MWASFPIFYFCILRFILKRIWKIDHDYLLQIYLLSKNFNQLISIALTYFSIKIINLNSQLSNKFKSAYPSPLRYSNSSFILNSPTLFCALILETSLQPLSYHFIGMYIYLQKQNRKPGAFCTTIIGWLVGTYGCGVEVWLQICERSQRNSFGVLESAAEIMLQGQLEEILCWIPFDIQINE